MLLEHEISLIINGEPTLAKVRENVTLLQFLRDQMGLMGTKNGCEKGHCGSCTVIVNGEAKRSCLIKLRNINGAKVETIEGISKNNELHPIQQSFISEGAVQCGFCTPGMIMATKALLDKNREPRDEEIKVALKHNLCRCTGYRAIIKAVNKAASILRNDIDDVPFSSGHETIGVSVKRKDVVDKVTGRPIYADDYCLENMLYGKLFFSEHSHAEIISIDTREAEQSQGVALVLTSKDIPGRNSFGLIEPQQPVIAKDRVCYLGDVVAAVFANTKEQAENARKKIKVVYKPLKTILSPIESMKEGSPLIHDKSNVVHHVKVRRGDVEKGFEKADMILEGEYYTPSVEHAYLEPEACLAKSEKDGSVTIWTGSQGSIAFQDMIAKSLNIPLDKVRVIYTPCGGAFGGKEEPTVQIHAALAALKTGCPVKMTLTREESIRMSTKRHGMHIWMKHGATKDGKLVAFQSKVIADAGAYTSLTKPVVFRSAVVAAGPYEIPNVKADSYGVYTNNNPAGAFRGFGSTQVSFAAEVQMDRLARKLGIDPIKIRQINGLKKGKTTITGQILKEGTGYIETLHAVEKSLEKLKDPIKLKSKDPNKKIGIGIASSYKNVGIGTGKTDHAGAILELVKEGRILLKIGATDFGQGSDTIMAQIAASILGVAYDLIDIVSCDTKLCPDGGMTTASRQTYVTGNAVKEGAMILKEKMIPFMINDQEKLDRKSLKEIYQRAINKGNKMVVEARYEPPKTYPLRESCDHQLGVDLEKYDIHYAYCFCTDAAIVEVDTTTGEVKVLKVIAAQDAGKAIHPQNMKGQIEGSVVMGIGYGLSEEYSMNENQIITDNLHELNLTKIANIPEIETCIVDVVQSDGPFGAKGMGEVPINPVAPAIANAIYDATGVRMTSLPMKKDKILENLKSLKNRT